MATSVPLHLADGWSYLARAVTAHLQGDYAASLHLAYYAELRAAIALLGSFGIAVSNFDHVIFEASSRGHVTNMGTHVFVWEALEHWSDRTEAQQFLERAIVVEGVPLRDWLIAFNPGGSFAPTARQWLRMWGLDLARFAQDRSARNRMSYDPTGIDSVETVAVVDAFRLIQSLWELVEPRPTPFDRLDRHLLRSALEAQTKPFKSIVGWFDTHLANAVSDLLPDQIAQQRISDFVRRTVEPNESVVVQLASRSSIEHSSVLARAALLLRVATASCRELLVAGSVKKSDITYWWQPWGEERGFWPVGAPPGDLLDMWQDIADALDAVSEWIAGQEPPGRSDFRGSWSSELQTLGGAERVALWSMPA